MIDPAVEAAETGGGAEIDGDGIDGDRIDGDEIGDGEEDRDLDALQDLGDEIATLAAHIHAATHRLLGLIAEFDRLRGWEPGGFRSCADWLAFRTGIRLGAAREKVRAARALEGLPETSASMARGELSFAKVRALTRVATPESEGELLEFARATTAAGLERLVRGWRRLSRLDEEAMERERHAARRFSVAPDLDGMYVVRGRLEPEVGAALMRAIEAASDALYREAKGGRGAADDGEAGADCGTDRDIDGGPGRAPELGTDHDHDTGSDTDTDREAARRRADAVGLLAERALAAGFRGGEAPISGSRAERYQVVVHVDEATLDGATPGTDPWEPAAMRGRREDPGSRRKDDAPGGSAPGGSERYDAEPVRSHLDDGTRVSAETSRRLACDAGVVRAVRGSDGSVLDVGRRTRTVPPALRRALDIRDGGCRFPGCGLRFTDAHHIRHWADGGETRLGNLVLLCRRHHRAVHQEGFRLHVGPTGCLNFYDPRGVPLPAMPHPLTLPEDAQDNPAGALVREGRSRGVDPDWHTASAGWKRESDIPLELLGSAIEALEAAG